MGVYWGDATLVMQPDFFVENVADATTDDVPMMVFADVRVEEVSDGVYRCFTTGMKSLGFHEIEVDETTMDPHELLEFVLDTAKYIVDEYLEIPKAIPLAETTINSSLSATDHPCSTGML